MEKELNTIRGIAEENGFPSFLTTKLIFEFRFRDNILKLNHKDMKYRKFNYNPRLYKKLRCTLLKHDINFIVYPPRKRKELVSINIHPFPTDEIAGICRIPFRTNENSVLEYIDMRKRKFSERTIMQILKFVAHLQLYYV